jgi:erythronate-4-phosphate dehydrogenase
LLQNSSIRFIGTATIGFDHIDTDFCKKNNIYWTNAPGCNADSVAQYILSSLYNVSLKNNSPLSGKTVGIVGVGNVGKKIEAACKNSGMNVLLNDPPRAEKESGFVDLRTIAEECDIITFHTPLILAGKYPTFHLADSSFFARLKKRPIICNSSRGEVVDSESLKKSYSDGTISEMIIDCWENEPDIDRSLLQQAFISTPHIAGYSTDGKLNATRMIVNALSDFFKLNIDVSRLKLPAPENSIIDLNSFPGNRTANAILATYNPMFDSDGLKEHPENFENFRSNYRLRREFPAYSVIHATEDEKTILRKLGFES